MKAIKILFSIVLVLVLLVVAAVIIVPLVVDPNDYKDKIASIVQDKTGRSINIEGDIKLSVFPFVGVKLGKVDLGNAPGFVEPVFASIGNAEVSAKLMPLFKKQLEVDTITLHGLALNLHRKADGSTNWDDLANAGAAEDEPADTDRTPEDLAANLVIGGLDLKDAKVSWTDEQAGQQYTIDQFNLQTGAIAQNKPVPVDMNFQLAGTGPDVQGMVSLKAVLDANMDAMKLNLTDLQFNTDMSKLPVAGANGQLALLGDVELDMNGPKIIITGLDLRVDGKEEASGTIGKLHLLGDLNADMASGAVTFKDLKLDSDLDQSGKMVAAIALTTDVTANIETGQIAAKGMTFSTTMNQPDVDMNGNMNITGDLNIEGFNRLALDGFTIDSKMHSGAEGIDITSKGGGEISMDIGTQQLNISNLRLDSNVSGPNTPVAGDVAIQGNVAADLANQIFNIVGLNISGALNGEAIPSGSTDLNVTADVNANLNAQTFAVEGLNLSALGLNATGDLQGTGITSDPNINGTFNLAPFNLREMLVKLGQEIPETSDPAVLGSISLNTRLQVSATSASFNDVTLMFDETTLNGRVEVPDFTGSALRFDLNVDQLNADRYLPTETAEPVTPGAAVASQSDDLPLEMLRGLDIDGSLKIGRFQVKNMKLNDIIVNLKAKDGQISMNPISAGMYGGSYNGNIRLDVRSDQPQIAVNEKLSGIEAGALQIDLLGEEKITGTADMSAQLTMAGIDDASIRRTLNGEAAFSFRNGAIKGINVGQIIRNATAAISGGESAEGPVQTDFAELGGSFRVTNGVVQNQDLAAKSPLLRLNGEGEVNLPEELLDYLLTATIVASAEGQGGKGLADLKGISIPVRITGTFSDPSITPDVEAILKAQANAALNVKKEELEAKARERLDQEKAKLAERLAEEQEKLQDQLGEQLGKQLGDQLGDQLGVEPGKDLEEGAKKLLKGLF